MSTVPGCTCPHGEGSLGTLYGIQMGRGTVRLGTTPGCPEHDTCPTTGPRGALSGRRRCSRGNPWCPIHGSRPCPAGAT